MKTDKQTFIDLKNVEKERMDMEIQKGTKDLISAKVGRHNMSKYVRGVLYKDLFKK